MKAMSIAIDGNMQFPTWLIRPSDTIDAKILAAGVARSCVIPAGATRVMFSATY